MENSLKQRIIGAIVLAALAIIFLPAILKEKASNGTFESKIPKKPQVLEEYRVDRDKIEKLKQAKSLEQSQQSQQDSLAKETSEAVADQPESLESEPVNHAEPVNQADSQASKSSSRKSKSKVEQNNQAKNSKVVDTADEKNKAKTATTEQPETLGSKFKSAAWVVQVASFSNESNAINLVEKLKKSQFKAYRRKSVADNKTVYRVYVGPFIDKSKAQDNSAAISKVSETKVVLRVFDPVKH